MTQRIALVTGGTGGLGTAMCTALADIGYKVVANYYTGLGQQAQEWQEIQQSKGYQFGLVEGDVADFEDCARMVQEVEAEFGPIDCLVNNAGITRDATIKKMSADKWDAVIQTNLNSMFYMTKQVVEGMMDRGYGRIVNISSVNGQKGQFGQANYSAAKAGVHGFTMALAQETARKGVTVNSISPGYIGTEMVMAIAEDVRKQIEATIPVGRLGKPEEIGRTVAFLAAEDAGYITGNDFSINGGLYMH
jgi:acetoacetyl-CoA reductase